MPQPTAGQRARRQTAPSGPPKEFKVQTAEIAEVLPESIESITDIKNELDFVQWYSEIENGLLESSYDEYQYAEEQFRSSLRCAVVFHADSLAWLDLVFRSFKRQSRTWTRSCLIHRPRSTSFVASPNPSRPWKLKHRISGSNARDSYLSKSVTQS
jgi:hypothetical protein